MVNADFRSPHAREEGLGLIGASAVFAVRLGMVDAMHIVVGVQGVPAPRLIGVDGRAHWHKPPHRGDRVAFLPEDEGERPSGTLAHDDYDLPLAGLRFGGAPINTLLGFILGFDVAAEIGAVDFLVAWAIQGRGRLIVADQLTQFVRENEGGLVLASEIAAQLRGAVALRAVHEDGDRQEIVAERALAISEDGSGRDRELMLAAAHFQTGRVARL